MDALDKMRLGNDFGWNILLLYTILEVHAVLNMAVDKVSGAQAVDDRVEACVL